MGASKKLKPPTSLEIDFTPSPKQYEMWKMLQPDYCPACGGHIDLVLQGTDDRGNPRYKPVCGGCGNDNLPQLVLGGGAAGKIILCQPVW